MRRSFVAFFIATATVIIPTAVLAQSRATESATAQSSTPADSSSETNQGLAEIVVTAQKRSENLQRVPISVSVATSDQLAAINATDVQDLKRVVPGVDIQLTSGYISPFLRGVGSRAFGAGVENPIAIYVDGVYYASAASSLFLFNNIADVEVLKGPQGTLFGRNATAGLIQVTTRDPTDTQSGAAQVTA